MDKPKVTVLISTFNRPHYLEGAIQSVIDQEFTNWELLVMNDGGMDVAEVIEGFADPRIKYFHDEVNRGPAYRFNFGIKRARGRYIAYLGDDDRFYPNHLEVLKNALDGADPGIAVVYSDLYAVSCIIEKETGRRFPIDKRIECCRAFNRNFMWVFNHVLHVSMLHRKEAAKRVGYFNLKVTSLIEWNLLRKMCFIYDFLHVPVLTGEYYQPIYDSDRISVLSRRNKTAFNQNTRIIKMDHPSEPWAHVDRVDVVILEDQWGPGVQGRVRGIIDDIDYPVRFVIVNNGSGKGKAECRAALGEIGILPNIIVMDLPQKTPDIEAYRFAAKHSRAAYLFLISKNYQVKTVNQRVIGGLESIRALKHPGVKWQIDQERTSPFDLLIEREHFLTAQKADCGYLPIGITALDLMPDSYLRQITKAFKDKEPQVALDAICEIRKLKKGIPGLPFLINHLVKACIPLEKFEDVEAECRDLIQKGYGADNWIKLGHLLASQKKIEEAIEAYRQGLALVDLKASDFDSTAFPFYFPSEGVSFTGHIGLGECLAEMGQFGEAAQHYHQAFCLCANSPRPFRGFAKLFAKMGQKDKTLVALKLAEKKG